MKTSEDWLKELDTKIKEAYEIRRMDKKLIGISREKEKPATTLWKYDHPPTAQEKHGMTITVMPPLKLRTVKPLQVGIQIDLSKINVEDAISESVLTSFISSYGKDVAEKEYVAIIRGLSDNAGNAIEAKNKGDLSKDDIKKAQSWIGENGRKFADTIIMPLEQETKFLKEGAIFEPHKILDGYVPKDERGPFFSGKLSGSGVYWMRFVKDFALVYAKQETMLINTPLKLYYDDPKELLTIEKWCSAAPILEQAVVKIQL